MDGIAFQSANSQLCIYCGTTFARSSQALFMLVSALMGLELMKEAYAQAIENGYRFYSYGVVTLLLTQQAL